MKRAFILFVVLAITVLGCNKPATPPDTGTTQPEQSGILNTALSTGCTAAKAYIAVNDYLPFAKPFIPSSVLDTAVPVLNAFHSALNLYMACVITWSDKKAQPEDYNQLVANLLKVKEEAMPIVQQIIQLVKDATTTNPDKTKKVELEPSAETLLKTKEVEKIINEKAAFGCTVEEFKLLAAQVKALPVIEK